MASALAYVLADAFATPDGVAVWFPPAAVTMAYLVRVGWVGVPLAFLTRLAGVGLVMDGSAEFGNLFVTGALVVAVYGTVGTWLRGRLSVVETRSAAVLDFGLAAALAGVGAAAASGAWLVMTGQLRFDDLGSMVWSFALGDASSVLTVTPILLVARPGSWAPVGSHRRRLEIAIQTVLLLGASWFAVVPSPDRPEFYLAFLPLVWIATRSGVHGASMALLGTGVAIPALELFVDRSPADMTSVQVFLCIYAFTGLLLGAGSSDRRRALDRTEVVVHELRAAHETQRACLAALDQGVALCDLLGHVHMINDAGERILGYSGAELTRLFQSNAWVTYREDGSVMPSEDRPIRITMDTGLAVHDSLVRWVRPDGSSILLSVSTEPVHDEHDNLNGVVIAFADVTERRAAEQSEQAIRERLAWQASHDSLTGLANRLAFMESLEHRLTDRRDRGRTAVLFVDLDHFKTVNDSLGHQSGDELLTEVARRIRSSVRPHDTVARFGGDEFVVLAERVNSLEAAEALAARIEAALREPALLSGGPVQVSASIGVAFGRRIDPEALLRRADVALYRAKAQRGPAPACEPAV